MKIETRAVHAGKRPGSGFGAVAPPIVLSSTFERAPDGNYPNGYIYSRSNNPNRSDLEACMNELEGGAAAAAFASGSAAAMSIFHALAGGDHVIVPKDVYYGTRLLLQELYARWNLLFSPVDMTDPGAVKQAVKPSTKLIWIETPSNPLLTVTDISAMCEIGREIGVLVACDNTWATPILQRPFGWGVDLIVHSTTKYIGGHSDHLGGCVVAEEESPVFERIRSFQKLGGAVPSPFECWLALRSIATLPYRVRAQSENAQQVATFLNEHSKVAAVHYPGLPGHPGHSVANAQMDGFGGMLSFQVAGGREEAMAVASRVNIITRATSLGGVESLIEHRASIEGPGSTAPQNLLRLSVGIENGEDLIADLDQALGKS